ncbi:tetratricopeptide repeat protein [Methylobacillus rhizosphaerae]|nr:tetratricopeptide repeat protein [Methylobacillus rhizosphaerae]
MNVSTQAVAGRPRKRNGGWSPTAQWMTLLALLLSGMGGVVWYVMTLIQPVMAQARNQPINMPAAVGAGSVNAGESMIATASAMEDVPESPLLADTLSVMAVFTPEQEVPPVLEAVPTEEESLPQQQTPNTTSSLSASHHIVLSRGHAAENQWVQTAYAAFNRGEMQEAEQAYLQAAQADARNVDALLGMAVIAVHQGRDQEAVSWYEKVLAVEPRHSEAQSALLELHAQLESGLSESALKSLVSQQPDAAYVHAALGYFYAVRKQWVLAQQAYFRAYQLEAGNPEHVFNLAVSLDQMGKQAIALEYYQQAQGLLANQSSGAIDQIQLAARIRQLQ